MPHSSVLQSLPQLVRAVQQDPQNFALEVPAPLVEKSEPHHLSANTVLVPLSTPDEDELRNNVPAGLHPQSTLKLVFDVISFALPFLQKYTRWTQLGSSMQMCS